jgi:hypothetical protein
MQESLTAKGNEDDFVCDIACRITSPAHFGRKDHAALNLRIGEGIVKIENEIFELFAISTPQTCMVKVRRLPRGTCPVLHNGSIGRGLIPADEIAHSSIRTSIDVITKSSDGNEIDIP